MIPFSVLDLVRETDRGIQATIDETVSLAQLAEKLGAQRYWFAEHHNTTGQLSTSPVSWISYILSKTESMIVGSGGMMLPNHAPLQLAEIFQTLEMQYPGRVDLGIGRRSGASHWRTTKALQLHKPTMSEIPYEALVRELDRYLKGPSNDVYSVPGHVAALPTVPMYLLGVSPASAKQAGHLGFPYAYGAHFSPEKARDSMRAYRLAAAEAKSENPYLIMCLHLCVADTDEEAQDLFTTTEQRFRDVWTGEYRLYQPPVPHYLDTLDEDMRSQIRDRSLALSVVGSPESVAIQLQAYIKEYQPNEFMFVCETYDQALREKSLMDVAEICEKLIPYTALEVDAS